MPTAGGFRYLKNAPGYTVSATVTAGQLVEADGNTLGTTQKIRPASAGSKVVLGYAVTGAVPDGTTADLTFIQQPSRVAVERACYAYVTFSADTVFGAKLIATANGQVGPAGATPDATTLVGQCINEGGVTAGSVGLAWIN